MGVIGVRGDNISRKELYTLTGRYMRGAEVVGYHVISGWGKQRRLSKDQFIFMLGQCKITNCTGQLYKDSVIVRGINGVNINELPVYDEVSKSVRRFEEVTNVKPMNGEMDKVLGQVTLVARIMEGRNNIGFEVRNYGGQIGRLERAKILDLADRRLITNAISHKINKNGEAKRILRGVGQDLRDLPTINIKG